MGNGIAIALGIFATVATGIGTASAQETPKQLTGSFHVAHSALLCASREEFVDAIHKFQASGDVQELLHHKGCSMMRDGDKITITANDSSMALVFDDTTRKFGYTGLVGIADESGKTLR